MKKIAVPVLLLFIISCNSHDKHYQHILDKLSGSYSIDSVVYITSAGQDSVLVNAGNFFINACDVDDNFSSQICSGSYEDSSGETTNFKFQLIDDEQMTITPKDPPAVFNVTSSSTTFYWTGNKLYLSFFKAENYAVYAEEGSPQMIVLSKK